MATEIVATIRIITFLAVSCFSFKLLKDLLCLCTAMFCHLSKLVKAVKAVHLEDAFAPYVRLVQVDQQTVVTAGRRNTLAA